MKKIRKLFAVIFAVAILTTAVVTIFASPVTPTLSVESANAYAGDTVDVKIEISNNPGIIGMGLNVDYDSDLTLIKVTDEGILGTAMHSDVYSMNPYYLNWANDTVDKDFTNNGAIATLTFAVAENAVPGLHKVEISYSNDDFEIFNYNAETVEFSIINGGIKISDKENTGKVHAVSIDDIKINYKKSIFLDPNVTADEGAAYNTAYESKNPDTVTVNQNGEIKAVKRGSANIKITVTDLNGNTVSDTCTVKVKYAWWQWIIIIVCFGWIWY